MINAAESDALPALMFHNTTNNKRINRTAQARSGGGPHWKPLHLKLCRDLFRKNGRTPVLRKFDRQIGDGSKHA